ncbi:hypothetical protein MMC24_006440 [Lignoscripta atroalba]|nr:hypothetical protein [Lignoscripta atroalba]
MLKPSQGSIPTFRPTSSPELDTLLSTFRTRIFLPSHLLRPQRALIYRTKLQRTLLGDEPVTVSLSGSDEVHTLQPLNRLTDEPNTKASFSKILELMKESSDWACLPGFLEGLKGSRRKVTHAMLEKMVRRAAEMGMQGVVMDCLRRVERTGVVLDGVGLAREVMWGAILKAIQSGWSEGGLQKALKYGEDVLEMMEDPRHMNGRKLSSDDPRCKPEIVGVVLHLAAVRASKFKDGKDEDGKVQKYTERMLAMWGNANFAIKEESWWDANYSLMMWSPVWYGMKMARQILGENSVLGRKLNGTLLQDVTPVVQRARDVMQAQAPEHSRRRGLMMYSDLSNLSE